MVARSHPKRRHGEAGQASLEYVGLVALVGLSLAALAVLVPRPARMMLAVVERAICTGLGHGCTIGGEESLALEPCPVRRSTTQDHLHATVMSIRAGSGRTAIVEERSDGSASVVLSRSSEVGAEGGFGAGVATGGSGLGARAETGAGLELGAGRGYRFRTVDAAIRFVREQRDSEFATWCTLCRLVGSGSGQRAPDFTYVQGGTAAHAAADVSVGPAHAGASAEGTALEGRRVDRRTGEVTTYHRLTGEAAAEAGGPLAGRASAGLESVVEYTRAPGGRPLELLIRSVHSGPRAGPALRGGGSARAGGAKLGGSSRQGDLVESVVALDLSERRDRWAARRFVAALGSSGHLAALPARTRSLRRRLDAGGEVEIRTFTTATRESALSGDAALGLKLGGGTATSTTDRVLTSAYTSPAGATLFLKRTDCAG